VVLHVRQGRGQRSAPGHVARGRALLLVDQDDRLFVYRVSAEDGHLIGGDPAIAGPAAPLRRGADPLFYGQRAAGPAGARGRGLGAHDGAGAAPARVLVQVAETLNRRNRLAWEILASVVVPQLLLILLAGTTCGVRRGRAACGPCSGCRRAVSDRSHRT
jgi:two-component system sensor histidine kinase TctE